jgi:hypothetical protein
MNPNVMLVVSCVFSPKLSATPCSLPRNFTPNSFRVRFGRVSGPADRRPPIAVLRALSVGACPDFLVGVPESALRKGLEK